MAIDPRAQTQLDALCRRLQLLLKSRLIALYAEGSLATGAFDAASDLDCVAVVRDPLSAPDVDALQSLHTELAAAPSPWATELEIWYVPPLTLRGAVTADARHLNLERGDGERLKWERLGADWIIHRATLHRCGIALCGPPAVELVDPLAPGTLRAAARAIAREWAAPLLRQPQRLQSRGYQSYAALSCCRLLYTLSCDEVTSKSEAAAWAATFLGMRWHALIASALDGRFAPGEVASASDQEETRALLHLLLIRCGST